MEILKTYNVTFLGKTGYGKSSLINGMFGTHFSTDPFYSCTKELYTVTTLDNAPVGYDAVSVYDTPGIGEFPDNDMYQKYYNYAASVADVIVLVSTFSRQLSPIANDWLIISCLKPVPACAYVARKIYVAKLIIFFDVAITFAPFLSFFFLNVRDSIGC